MVLFINACMRGPKLSRTHRLCKAFFGAVPLLGELEEVDLTAQALPRYDAPTVQLRERLIDGGKTDDEMFLHARQFARAEKIVVGAPYWDLSFPAALKSYIEHVSVRTITFDVAPTGTVGLCRAQKLVYITTAGGYIADADFGSAYFRGLCGFYGIPQFESISAQGLDLQENAPEIIMISAEREAARAAARF